MPETAPSLFSWAKHRRPSHEDSSSDTSVIHYQSYSGSLKDLGLTRLYKHHQSKGKLVGQD